jgi:hypothetical protein
MGERANVFGESDFVVSDFTPSKPAVSVKPETARVVAERVDVSSREPERKRPRREPRCYRTGRNAQFSCNADPAIVDELYAIINALGLVQGPDPGAGSGCPQARAGTVG